MQTFLERKEEVFQVEILKSQLKTRLTVSRDYRTNFFVVISGKGGGWGLGEGGEGATSYGYFHS